MQLVALLIRNEIGYLIYRRYKKSRQQEKQNLFEFLLLSGKDKGLARIHG
jgi:hypothetical protein